MRLHQLTLTAFGSFGDTETIDFDLLSDAGLFLLHGPTGAGKTTILDAVSFALFGKVAGVRAAGESLRSHHAPATIATEVRLDVSLDGRRYRIVRRPKQLRPKQRGDGLREHGATASVAELMAGTWVDRGNGPSQVDPFLQEHLHMEADQFHQIVMLPQGDFARFLRASADDRRQALEELFGTQRFADLERWLRARSETARQAVARADEQARRVLVEVRTIADVDPFDDDQPLGSALDWVTTLVKGVDERVEGATDAEQRARGAHDQARATLTAAIDLRRDQLRHASAVASAQDLIARVDEQVVRRAERDRAQRAASVIPLIQLVDVAAAAAGRAQRDVDERRARLASSAPTLADADDETLVLHDETLVGELRTIDESVDDERSLTEREAALDQIDQQLEALTTGIEQLAAARRDLPTQRSALDDDLVAARAAASRLAGLRQAELALSARLDAATERDRLEVEQRRQSKVVDRLDRQALDARERWLQLLESHLAAQAARLAADLVDGAPCAVCGSIDHPDPATGSGPLVSEAEVADAHDRSDRGADAARLAAEALVPIEQHLAVAVAEAGDESTVDLTTQLTDQRALVTEARACAEAIAELELRVDELDRRAEAMDDQLESANHEMGAARQHRGELAAALRLDRDRIIVARAGYETLGGRRAALDAERAHVAAALDASSRLSRAQAQRADATDRARLEATRRDFADLDEARAAGRDDDAIAELVIAIEAHDREVAEAQAEVSRPELLAAAAAAVPDIESLERQAAEAERAWDLASTSAAAARRAAGQLHERRAAVDHHLRALEPLIADHEHVRHLADLAGGDDRQVEHRMRLSTYVLAARLEQVAAAASERLQRMSGGRFTIVHTDEAVDGRRKGGLGLRIVDAWTSSERDTASLSGGETFFTSLALALGVADVVGAEAGGVQLDTMFIDEGFGSLDDDTLHEVMDVLDGLRAGGRTIGIVSHVSDLRDRITSQVEVVKGARGSHVRVTASGDDSLARTQAVDRTDAA